MLRLFELEFDKALNLVIHINERTDLVFPFDLKVSFNEVLATIVLIQCAVFVNKDGASKAL